MESLLSAPMAGPLESSDAEVVATVTTLIAMRLCHMTHKVAQRDAANASSMHRVELSAQKTVIIEVAITTTRTAIGRWDEVTRAMMIEALWTVAQQVASATCEAMASSR